MSARSKKRHSAERRGFRLVRRYGRFAVNDSELCRSAIRGADYESFTDSWFSADMNSGRRAPRFVGLLRQPRQWDDRKMIEIGACTL
jgi:hypothetical protein